MEVFETLGNVADGSYLAGLFDSKGGIYIFKRSGKNIHEMYIAISANQEWYIEYLENRYELGTILFTGGTWTLRIQGVEVDKLLNLIEPYSVRLLKQIKIARLFRETQTSKWKENNVPKREKRKVRGVKPIDPVVIRRREELRVELKKMKENK